MKKLIALFVVAFLSSATAMAADTGNFTLELDVNVGFHEALDLTVAGTEAGTWSHGHHSSWDMRPGKVRIAWKINQAKLRKGQRIYARDITCDGERIDLAADATSVRVTVAPGGTYCKLRLVEVKLFKAAAVVQCDHPDISMSPGRTPSDLKEWKRCPSGTIPFILGSTKPTGGGPEEARRRQTILTEQRAVEALPTSSTNGYYYRADSCDPIEDSATVYCLSPSAIIHRDPMHPPDPHRKYPDGMSGYVIRHEHHVSDVRGGLPDPPRRFRASVGVTGYGLWNDGPTSAGAIATGVVSIRAGESNWWGDLHGGLGWTSRDEEHLWTGSVFVGMSWAPYDGPWQLSLGGRGLWVFDLSETVAQYYGGEAAVTYWFTDWIGIRVAGTYGAAAREVDQPGQKLSVPAGYDGPTETGGTSVDWEQSGGGNASLFLRF